MTEYIRAFALWTLLWAGPVLALTLGVYFLGTLPARRRERARLFLDLLETGLEQGRSVEHTITELAKLRDRTLGARFYLVAAWIESGETFLGALLKVPAFLPAGVIGILKAGMESGQLARAVRGARTSISNPLGRTRHALHYAFVLLLMVIPFSAVFLPLWAGSVFPKVIDIIESMEVPVHPLTVLVARQSGWLLLFYGGLMALFAILVIAYVAGPSVLGPSNAAWRRAFDRAAFALPWRKKRLQRDFSMQLGLLLEAQLPEAAAVRSAMEGTANAHMRGKLRRVLARLGEGVNLPDALAELDEGQLQWRVANALGGGGFLQSLRGWHEALEADANRSEDAAAQMLSTALILLNGVVVGLMVSAFFIALTSIINEAATI